MSVASDELLFVRAKLADLPIPRHARRSVELRVLEIASELEIRRRRMPIVLCDPAIANIQRVVASAFKIAVDEMKSKRRARWVARPRQVAMYLARECTGHSLPRIGFDFGGRDHTTVMHAIKRVEELARYDADFGERVSALREHLWGQ